MRFSKLANNFQHSHEFCNFKLFIIGRHFMVQYNVHNRVNDLLHCVWHNHILILSARHANTGVKQKIPTPARFSHGKSDPSDIAKIKPKTNVIPAAIILASFLNGPAALGMESIF